MPCILWNLIIYLKTSIEIKCKSQLLTVLPFAAVWRNAEAVRTGLEPSDSIYMQNEEDKKHK